MASPAPPTPTAKAYSSRPVPFQWQVLQCIFSNGLGIICMLASDAVTRWTSSRFLGGCFFYLLFVLLFARIYKYMKKAFKIPYIGEEHHTTQTSPMAIHICQLHCLPACPPPTCLLA